eukprot:Selendium_serpulae@DN5813_c0_g1_i9.p1
MPMFQKLLQDFIRVEVIPWPLPAYAQELEKHPVFQSTIPALPPASAFPERPTPKEAEASAQKEKEEFTKQTLERQREAQVAAYAGGDKRWTLLRKRVLQHNLKVCATYFKRITMGRLSAILGVDMEHTEAEISELVTSGFLRAKMDRPNQIVVFGDKMSTRDVLDEWGGDINGVLNLVEESCHLIAKERMVQDARVQAAVAKKDKEKAAMS